MSDQLLQMQTQPQQQAAMPLIPTQGASHFAITVSPAEILVAVGHSRAFMTQTTQGGKAALQLVQEWIMSLSISPNGAKALQQQLNTAIELYENRFGEIAVDASASVQIEQQQ